MLESMVNPKQKTHKMMQDASLYTLYFVFVHVYISQNTYFLADPECLEIDSNMKCFKAEKNCAHESTL